MNSCAYDYFLAGTYPGGDGNKFYVFFLGSDAYF